MSQTFANEPSEALSAEGQAKLRYSNGTFGISISGGAYFPLAFEGDTIERVSVKSYGAAGDGVTNDYSACAAALTAAIASGRVLYFPPGTYKLNSTLDFTQADYLTIAGAGRTSILLGANAGQPVIDCTGANLHVFRDFYVKGDSTNKPSCAFLFSRKTGNASSGTHTLFNVGAYDYFTKAAVVSISSETNRYNACELNNSHDGGWCVAITEQNDLSATSPYQTIPGSITGGNTVHQFFGGILNCFSTNGAGGNLLVKEARDVSTHGTFFSAGNSCLAGVKLDGTVTDFSIHGGSGEWGGVTYGVQIAASATWSGGGVFGFTCDAMLRGEDSSTVSNVSITGEFSEAPRGFDFANLHNSNINPQGYTFRVRTACRGNIFWGGSGNSATFDLTGGEGNIYAERTQGGDGNSRTTWHLGKGATAGRSLVAADSFRPTIMKQKVQWFSATTGGTAVPSTLTVDMSLGSAFSVRLDKDVTISAPSNILATGNAYDEGAELHFDFLQDGTGGRTLTWNAAYVLTNWTPNTGIGKRNSISFRLNPEDGKWWQFAGVVAP